METGTRVYVKTALFEGSAVIDYITTGEMLPVQVELDQADQDGQKVKRVSWHHVQKLPRESTVYPQENTEKKQPLKQRYIAKVKDHRNGFRIGSEYIIGPSNHADYYNVYLIDGTYKGPVGAYRTNFFEIIKPFTELTESDKLIKEEELTAMTTKEDMREREKAAKSQIEELQLTLFDFLEVCV